MKQFRAHHPAIRDGEVKFRCSTLRSIITAGHCICKELDIQNCQPNDDRNSPINQILPGGRDTGLMIYYHVGQKVIDERIHDNQINLNFLHSLPRAREAFIYEIPEEVGQFYNAIGLLIVNIADWRNKVRQNIVRPIDLPDNSDRYIIN